MKLELLNCVILAEDYEKVRDWWIDVLELELRQEWTEHYHYAELARDGTLVVGIADAKEMDATPSTPRTNATLPQLQVEDVKALLERVKAKDGDVPFGPSFEEHEKFWFGGFTDIEGNPVWVISPPGSPR